MPILPDLLLPEPSNGIMNTTFHNCAKNIVYEVLDHPVLSRRNYPQVFDVVEQRGERGLVPRGGGAQKEGGAVNLRVKRFNEFLFV